MRAARLAVLVAVLAAGCSRCGTKAGAEAGIERVLPRNAVAVVVVPSLERSGEKLRLLEQVKVAGFVAPLQGFASARAFADALVGQLGVDVRNPAELAKAGLDPARGLAAAALLTGDAYLVLPVKDAAALHARLEGLAVNRLGAGAAGEQTVGRVVVKTFSRQQGQPPRLGYALADGWAFVAADAAIAKLPQAASLTDVDRLTADAQLTKARASAGAVDVYAWFPSGSVALQPTPLLNAFVTATLTPSAFTVDVTGQWKGAPELLAALEARPARDVAVALPADAFLTGRYTGDAAGLGALAKAAVGPLLARAFDEGGLDVRAEVLEQLEPGAVFSLSLADRPPMDRGVPSFDVRQTNPFAYVHLSGVAPVKQAAVVMPTLEKVAALAPRFGARLERQQRDGKELFFTTWSQGQGVHFAPKGATVVFASPVQRLDALLASPAAPGPMATAAHAVEVKVDLVKLSGSVRALPESAWGLGGFALKPTTVRWLDATDDLRAVTLRLGAEGGVVKGRLVLSLGLPAPGAKAP
ncbi:MAG: hypothetical protein INH37_06110 [Myxococcaceae bacterium]|nr:hypothetical protein [Myxococcaceae bacterium]